MGADNFVYDEEHRGVVCERCGTCLAPGGPRNWKDHLGKKPHHMKGDELRRTIGLLSTYDLRGKEELRQWRPNRRTPCRRIEHLVAYNGYICTSDRETCDFVTTRLDTMYGHMPRHGKRASQHCKLSPLWEACVLQTYFTAKGRIDYFTVHQSNDRQDGSPGPSTRLRGERKGGGSMDQPLQYIGPPPSAAE